MDLEWQYSPKGICWQEVSDLYKKTPLGNKRPVDLEMSFTNSMFRCFVFEQGRLIGIGRALADGVDCSYICDVAVLPEYQGIGIGKSIVSRLIASSKGHKKIILYACPGKEPFYKRLGFKRMSTAMAIFENQNQAIESGFLNET
ncbi:MAG: GNAT family N-acetyltransferase [Gammaproteobacteria bacterium]|nr:GNAT family N-acetyltransferase [Gammaproteobacteria bacterium]MCF6364267.1 GNAT family N-acetyltransferase [Gammaproteobacteria bacterium]